MEKKISLQYLSVSNGVEWCGVKWFRVTVMTLESLVEAINCTTTYVLFFAEFCRF